MKEKKQQLCPDKSLIERFILDDLLDIKESLQIYRHITKCKRCLIIFNEQNRFHEIFKMEINQPISSASLDFLASLNDPSIEFFGIILKPVEPLNGHKCLDYFAEIVKPYDQKQRFQDIKLKKGEIFFRAVKSRKTNKTTLFLTSPQKKLYDSVRIEIYGEDFEFHSDNQGKIELGNFEITNFEQQIVLVDFSEKHSSPQYL